MRLGLFPKRQRNVLAALRWTIEKAGEVDAAAAASQRQHVCIGTMALCTPPGPGVREGARPNQESSHEPEEKMREPVRFYGWKLLAVLWLILFTNFGFPMYGASVINVYMAADLHLDRTTLGSAFAIFQFMVGVPGPVIAVLISKKGARFTLVAGCLLVMVGSLLMALYVRTSLQVFIVFGLVVGLGVMTGGTLATQSAVEQWFARRRTMAISVLLSGTTIGGFVASPVLDRLIRASGGNWRTGWWSVAACSIFAMLLAFFFVKERPADLGQIPDGEIAVLGSAPAAIASQAKRRIYQTNEEWALSEVWRSPASWLMLVACLTFSPGFSAYLAHGVVHLKDLGYTPAEAAFSLSVMLAASLLGNVVVAAVGDHIEPRLIWAAASLLFGGGLLLLLKATGPAGLWVYAILMGVGFGAYFPCIGTLPASYFGHKTYASVVGVLAAAGTISGALGTYGAGYSYDHFGSYAPAFYSFAVLCLISFLLLIALKPPVRKRAGPALVAGGHDNPLGTT